MKRFTVVVLGLTVALCVPNQAQAFTSKQKRTVGVTASGVTDTSSLDPIAVVDQGTADTASPLDFGTGGNDFRDSGEALKVNGTTNAAANRILIYTDNLNAGAVPQAQLDTSLGNDGGGLVGVTDRSQIVPMVWVVKDTNVDHAFTTATIGNDEIYITDLAHVATYVDAVLPSATGAEKEKLDTLAMKRCDNNAPVANPNNAGTTVDPNRYPQFFGSNLVFNSDLCNAGALVTIDPNAAVAGDEVTIAANAKVPFAEELSKNIAVVAFNCLGTACTAPDLSTADPGDSISVALPIYLPLGADFRTAPAQDYSTSTLTVDLVTQ